MPAVKIFIATSGQHGQGVFAAVPIRAGEAILEFSGPLKTLAQLRAGEYHLQIGEALYLGASGGPDDYVNHSCQPNAGFRGGLMLTARRHIARGEEITWDYSTAIDEADFPGFACRCGAPQCRGVVHSFRRLDAAYREQLRPWLLSWLRAKYFPGDQPGG